MNRFTHNYIVEELFAKAPPSIREATSAHLIPFLRWINRRSEQKLKRASPAMTPSGAYA